MRKKVSPTLAGHSKTHVATNCAFCRNFHEFSIPDHLIEQLKERKVVVFAGAGVSTEARTVFPFTFYDEIHGDLRLGRHERPTFPALMTMFCKQPDGRRKLLEKLRSRFDYIETFPELLSAATRFHNEIATLFYVDTFITTNWDNYFERYCGATPFVTAEDFAFWNVKGRKVFKIHGSVGNYGSVIATTEDYRRAQRQLERGALGSALKMLLSTRTILYVGYSFSDKDFINIQQYIAREMKDVAPAAYIVSLEKSAEARFRAHGLIPIFTDAAHFVAVIKTHLEQDGCFLSASRLQGVQRILARVAAEHRRLFRHFDLKSTPAIVYAAAYQDGLAHAFERVLTMGHTGQYSHRCELTRQIHKYELIKKNNLQRRRYDDVAYVEGYVNGLFYLLLDDDTRKHLPLYFGFGMPETRTLNQYKRVVARRGGGHKAAEALARSLVRKGFPKDELHHRPFLDWDD